MITAEHRFDVAHPTAAGHFPGNPIIPGAVLLDAVLCVVRAQPGLDATCAAIPTAKFLHPVRPGDTLSIALQATSHAVVKFECRVAGQIALIGTLRLTPPLPA